MSEINKELIDSFREYVLPFVSHRLYEANFEVQGETDKAEFEHDFNEILDLALSALQQGRTNNNLINRDEFRKHYCMINCGERQCVDHADRCSFIDELMQFKTEPGRQQGKWIVVKSPLSNKTILKCDKCGEEFIGYDVEDYSFCPICGADERGGVENV